MHDPNDLGTHAMDRRLHLIRVEYFAIRPFDHGHLGTGPLRHVLHPRTEDAIDADQHLVARLDQVDDHGLHAGRARPRDGQRHPIRGLKGIPQQFLGLIHQGHELGVQVATRGIPIAARTRGCTSLWTRPISSQGEGLSERASVVAGRRTREQLLRRCEWQVTSGKWQGRTGPSSIVTCCFATCNSCFHPLPLPLVTCHSHRAT